MIPTNKKIHVAVLFGGKSAEHEISVISAKNVVAALDPNKYEVTLIGIDKTGVWHLEQIQNLLQQTSVLPNLNQAQNGVALMPGKRSDLFMCQQQATSLNHIDVVFPVLHGPLGEDGTVQGLLKIADVPFVGPGVLSSSVCMDKDVMKRLLRDAGLPVAKFLVFRKHERTQLNFGAIEQELGLPFFIKPANLGSSVGISKVHNEAEFLPALTEAFSYDNKIIIEEFTPGREIECAVLGNDNNMQAALPAEIIPQHEFYSYEAKYLDPNGAKLEVPAKLAPDIVKKFQSLAIQAAQALCCEGMARVDCFLQGDGNIYINEVNTIPGFTAISMYPASWIASGINYAQLIDYLIKLAIERHQQEAKLNNNFTNTAVKN